VVQRVRGDGQRNITRMVGSLVAPSGATITPACRPASSTQSGGRRRCSGASRPADPDCRARVPRGRGVRDAAIVAGVVALTSSPYLVFNLIKFHHLVPISGAIKSSLPSVMLDLDNLGTLGKITSLAAVLTLPFVRLLPAGSNSRTFLTALSASVILHGFYVVAFTHDVTQWSWYYVLGVVNIAFLMCVIARASGRVLSPTARLRIAAAVAAFILIVGIARAWNRYRDPDAVGIAIGLRSGTPASSRWQVEVAGWMRKNLPSGSGVFVYDWPGTIAYFSGLRVLGADGLMSDYDFSRDIAADGIGAYLREHDVRYVFAPAPPEGAETQLLPVTAPLTGAPAGGLISRIGGNCVSGSLAS